MPPPWKVVQSCTSTLPSASRGWKHTCGVASGVASRYWRTYFVDNHSSKQRVVQVVQVAEVVFNSCRQVLTINGAPASFAANEGKVAGDTLTLLDDQHADVAASAVGDFGRGDFSVQLTVAGLGSGADPSPDGSYFTLFIRSGNSVPSPCDGPSAFVHTDTDEIVFRLRRDDELRCPGVLSNMEATAPRKLRFVRSKGRLSVDVDGKQVCSHEMGKSADYGKFMSAPVRFGGNNWESHMNTQNTNLRLSDIAITHEEGMVAARDFADVEGKRFAGIDWGKTRVSALGLDQALGLHWGSARTGQPATNAWHPEYVYFKVPEGATSVDITCSGDAAVSHWQRATLSLRPRPLADVRGAWSFAASAAVSPSLCDPQRTRLPLC